METLSVSALNAKIKSLLEATFMQVIVEGEVSQATYHTSGHLYFTIKDAQSSLRCVMWRSSVAKMRFRIEKGMRVILHGAVSVYTPRGEYQLQTSKVEPYGQGALALAFEQLKRKLHEKGYFDQARKKPLPRFPMHIVIVTAKESAALADMLRIIRHRWPLLEVSVLDTLVQGEAAATQIARSLRYADGLCADIVVVGRGGGSKEDLWPFNEEVVADAIYRMDTPVVSAVGHEVDTHISDMVADLRAPTPSAAMEMILPDRNEVLQWLDERLSRLQNVANEHIRRKEERLRHLSERLRQLSATTKLTDLQERFDDYAKRISSIVEGMISSQTEALETYTRSMNHTFHLRLREKERFLKLLLQHYESSDPAKKKKKGWVQISKNDKTVSLAESEIGDRVTLQDLDWVVDAKIAAKRPIR